MDDVVGRFEGRSAFVAMFQRPTELFCWQRINNVARGSPYIIERAVRSSVDMSPSINPLHPISSPLFADLFARMFANFERPTPRSNLETRETIGLYWKTAKIQLEKWRKDIPPNSRFILCHIIAKLIDNAVYFLKSCCILYHPIPYNGRRYWWVGM